MRAKRRFISFYISHPGGKEKELSSPPHFDPDVGTEELGHLEMVGSIVQQLTRDMTEEEIKKAGMEAYFVDHTAGVYPQFASGTPWTAATFAVKGDVIADLTEDLAAEQKARVTYDNILRLSDDPDVNNVIRFLREREVVHFQRFGEALRLATEKMDKKNVYAINPAFDK
ncbi:MAG: manganese catalase family protein [Oscillospiraceae bacterium]|nr:manganese catalase family protein [Oscillospiraceae bacterium]